MKKARVVRWESLEVYCVGRWVLRQRSQYLMCLALSNFGMGEEAMLLLTSCLRDETVWRSHLARPVVDMVVLVVLTYQCPPTILCR